MRLLLFIALFVAVLLCHVSAEAMGQENQLIREKRWGYGYGGWGGGGWGGGYGGYGGGWNRGWGGGYGGGWGRRGGWGWGRR
uniref:Uncharacterized protein n=1 Tax=Globodera pallida TaxID=36090 RepID=A0A183CEL7_GLOPA